MSVGLYMSFLFLLMQIYCRPANQVKDFLAKNDDCQIF